MNEQMNGFEFTTVANKKVYDLPTDFAKMVDLDVFPINNLDAPFLPTNIKYEVINNRIHLKPTPPASYIVVVWYIPKESE